MSGLLAWPCSLDGQTGNARMASSSRTFLNIYLLLVTVVGIGLLVWFGAQGLFYWTYPLIFLTAGCIASEWLVINLPQGDRLTLSIIFILLAVLFSQDQSVPLKQMVGAVEVVAVGSLLGYGLVHRSSWLHKIFYVAQYILAASLAGGIFLLVSDQVPPWLVTVFHLPAVTAYVVVFSVVSAAMVGVLNARILQGPKLPKADPLFVVFLAPIALSVYYFFQTRHLSVVSVIGLALPLLGVLGTFRLYINIDTEHGEVKQLYEISKSFVAAMSQEETVQRVSQSVVQAINDLVACDACLIYVRSGESNEYLLVDPESGTHGPVAIMPEQGLLGRILAGGQGDIINDVGSRSELAGAEQRWTSRTAILAYPLFAEGQAIGLLVLVRYRRGFDAEQFRMIGIVANQVGVTVHNAQMYEKSLQKAEMDQKLGILNHAAFMQRAQRVMGRAQYNQQPVALLLGDIDDFRKINNAFGHDTGDKVLIGVAALMNESVSEPAFVGRRGGEELVVLLPNTDEHGALRKAEEIRHKIEEHVFESVEGREVRATISAGVALFPRDASDIISLDRLADRSAYLAKRMGKNRVCLYEDQKEKLEFVAEIPVHSQSLLEAQRQSETAALARE